MDARPSEVLHRLSSRDSSYVSSSASSAISITPRIRDQRRKPGAIGRLGRTARCRRSLTIGTFANSTTRANVPSNGRPGYEHLQRRRQEQVLKNVILTYDDGGAAIREAHHVQRVRPGFPHPDITIRLRARGYISHKPHYIGSMLHFIENNWNLGSLHTSDARSDAFDDVFNYKQAPLKYIPVNAANPLGVLVDADLPWYGRQPTGADRD